MKMNECYVVFIQIHVNVLTLLVSFLTQQTYLFFNFKNKIITTSILVTGLQVRQSNRTFRDTGARFSRPFALF